MVARRYGAELARAMPATGAPTIHDAATAAVERKDGGRPIDAAVRGPVEAHLGADLSDARVHDDAIAQQASAAMGARAFAHGADVFLGAGESERDLALMAHELTHVVQQGATGRRAPQRQVQVGDAHSPAEAHADAVAAAVTAAQAAPANLLVDDGPIQPGQMLKSQFIDQLRPMVTAAADEELGPIYSAIGCPYIDRYFGRYALEPAAAAEALLRRFAPAVRSARTAEQMIPVIVARVRDGVRTWRETGQPPPEIAAIEPRAAGGPAAAALGDWSSLDPSTASRLGAALGDRFEDVRIHTGPEAAQFAASQGAKAVAVGQDVAFAAGAYTPGTDAGDALLAHELAHVSQQRGNGAPVGEAEAEAEANQAALSAVAAGHTPDALASFPAARARGGLSLRRCTDSPPPAVTYLRGQAADEQLTAWGCSMSTDPALSDGERALVCMHMQWVFHANVTRTHMIAVERWEQDTPERANAWVSISRPGNQTSIPFLRTGLHTMRAIVRAGVDEGGGSPHFYELTIERQYDVSTTEEVAAGALDGTTRRETYREYRDLMEVQRTLMSPGGSDQQAAGDWRIDTSAPNPATVSTAQPPATLGFGARRVTPGAGVQYRWYAAPSRWDGMPDRLGTAPQVTVEERRAYDLGTGTAASLPSGHAGLWVIWFHATDDTGAQVGEATYLQTILSADDARQLTRLNEYLTRTDGNMAHVDLDRTVALTGVHVGTQSGVETHVRLFLGPDRAATGSYRVVDATPGLDPSHHQLEFTGGTPEAALREFFAEQEYPRGTMVVDVPANDLQLAQNRWTMECTGQGFLDRLSGALTAGGVAALVAGVVLAPFTGGVSLEVAMVVAGVAGAAAGTVSLIDHLQRDEISWSTVTLDVIQIASSLINAGAAIRAMRAGPAVLVAGRSARFLMWTNFVADAVSALLITAEGVEQLVAVVGDDNLSPEEKRQRVVQIVTNLVMAGGMLAVSYGQLRETRSRMRGVFGEALTRELGDEMCLTLALLDDDTLRRVARTNRDELGRLAGALRDEPGLLRAIQAEQRLARVLPLMAGETAEDFRFAQLRLRAHEAGVGAAESERLVAVLKGGNIRAATAHGWSDGALAALGQRQTLDELEGVAAAARAGTVTGYEAWLGRTVGRDGAELAADVAWAAEARKAAQHHGVAIDLNAPTAEARALVSDRQGMRWQMDLKNRKLAAAGEPARYPDLDVAVNAGMDNLAAARARGFPYGFGEGDVGRAKFHEFSARLHAGIAAKPAPAGGIPVSTAGANIQGSACYRPLADDVDVALLVDEAEYRQLIEQSFPNQAKRVRDRGLDPFTMSMAQATNSAEETMLNAIQTGILKRDKVRPRLSDVRDQLQTILGERKVDLSIVLRGGQFDRPPYFPIPRGP